MKLVSAGSALRTRQESRKLGGFSKQWQSGQTLSVFYPIFWVDGKPEIMVAQNWGHSIDPKQISLRRIFIPSNSEIVDGDPTTQDTLYQFSRLAPLFLKGAYQAEVDKLEEKRVALGDSAYKQKLKQIDKDFDVEDGKIGKQAVVGKLRLVISTEVVTVLMENGKPKVDTTKLVTQDLSDNKIQKLYQLMDNPQYAPEPGDKFFEVTYTFGTKNDRKLDAQVDPTGVVPEYKLATRFAGEWETIKRTIEMLPESSETISKRNSSYRRVPENEIMQSIATYAVMQAELLDNLTEDEDIDRLKKNAAMLRKLSIRIENKEVMDAVEELNKLELPLATEVVEENDSSELSGAPTMKDLLIDKEEIVEARNDETHYEDEVGSEHSGLGNLVE